MKKKILKPKPNQTSTNSAVETRSRKILKDCHICYGKIDQQGKIDSCKHSFCYNCIKKWSKVLFFHYSYRGLTHVLFANRNSRKLKKCIIENITKKKITNKLRKLLMKMAPNPSKCKSIIKI